MTIIKKNIKKIIQALGYDLVKRISPNSSKKYQQMIPELTDEEIELIRYVIDRKLSMVPLSGLIATLKACKYVVENEIPGAFVECGVWRGGNVILAKKMFELMGSDKKVYLFDTFEGMTDPTEFDIHHKSQKHATDVLQNAFSQTNGKFFKASIEEVKNNFHAAGVKLDNIIFIKGDVFKTLGNDKNLPNEIAVLRLDTDWYESTKKELEILYPKLVSKGVLLIDDYGFWAGSRKAVDEYFKDLEYKPLLNVIDFNIRSAIKH